MDQGNLLTLVETTLRVALGLRFLYSGVSNVRRWPNAVRNAEIVSPSGTTALGLIAVFLMLAGGLGLALGFQTRLAAAMIALFLVPTFKIQRYWLRTLPAMIEGISHALARDDSKEKFRVVGRQALHSHETGWRDNLLMLLVALFFVVRGSPAFGIDNLLG